MYNSIELSRRGRARRHVHIDGGQWAVRMTWRARVSGTESEMVGRAGDENTAKDGTREERQFNAEQMHRRLKCFSVII